MSLDGVDAEKHLRRRSDDWSRASPPSSRSPDGRARRGPFVCVSDSVAAAGWPAPALSRPRAPDQGGSRKMTCVCPKHRRSRSCNAWRPWTRLPLTNVPLRESPSSTTVHCPPTSSSSACARETSASAPSAMSESGRRPDGEPLGLGRGAASAADRRPARQCTKGIPARSASMTALRSDGRRDRRLSRAGIASAADGVELGHGFPDASFPPSAPREQPTRGMTLHTSGPPSERGRYPATDDTGASPPGGGGPWVGEALAGSPASGRAGVDHGSQPRRARTQIEVRRHGAPSSRTGVDGVEPVRSRSRRWCSRRCWIALRWRTGRCASRPGRAVGPASQFDSGGHAGEQLEGRCATLEALGVVVRSGDELGLVAYVASVIASTSARMPMAFEAAVAATTRMQSVRSCPTASTAGSPISVSTWADRRAGGSAASRRGRMFAPWSRERATSSSLLFALRVVLRLWPRQAPKRRTHAPLSHIPCEQFHQIRGLMRGASLLDDLSALA